MYRINRPEGKVILSAKVQKLYRDGIRNARLNNIYNVDLCLHNLRVCGTVALNMSWFDIYDDCGVYSRGIEASPQVRQYHEEGHETGSFLLTCIVRTKDVNALIGEIAEEIQSAPKEVPLRRPPFQATHTIAGGFQMPYWDALQDEV